MAWKIGRNNYADQKCLLLDNFTPHVNVRKVRIQVGRNNHDVVCATNGLIEHNYQTGRR